MATDLTAMQTDYTRTVLRAESDADRSEDAISDLRLIERDCPVHIAEHAKRLDHQAATSRTAARVLWAQVRSLGGLATRARQRLGLAPHRA